MGRWLAAVVFAAGVWSVAAWPGAAFSAPKHPLPLSARLIERGELAGYDLEPATPFTTAKAWINADTSLTKAQASAQIARLQREGFKSLLTEYLDRGQVRQDGLSWVLQLGSAAAARAELEATLRDTRAQCGCSFESFPVRAVPGARGFREAVGGNVGENILFADGPYLYLVAQAWASSESSPPTRASLVAAATKLYARVRGR